jgi:hypothetical protein
MVKKTSARGCETHKGLPLYMHGWASHVYYSKTDVGNATHGPTEMVQLVAGIGGTLPAVRYFIQSLIVNG